MEIIDFRSGGPQGGCISIGNFDGLHRAHRELLLRVKELSQKLEVPAGVVSFWPPPSVVINQEFPFLLTTRNERKELLSELGLDFLYEIEFTPELRRTEPEDFFIQLVYQPLRPRVVVVGPDHRFGWNRQGDADLLQKLSSRLGFELEIFPLQVWSETPLSSTRIRELLLLGDLEGAERLLGRRYGFKGSVVKGEGMGHRLGFPTLNLKIDPTKLLPADGVYAVRVSIAGKVYPGALYIGHRPTFDGSERRVEVYIIGFEEDSPSRELGIELFARLRPEERFPNSESLTHQIQKDVKRAQELLESGGQERGC